MILLFDENLPVKVARVVAALGTDGAHHLTDHLDRGTSDEDIFAWLEGRDWLLVTQDRNMSKKKHQIAEIQRHKVGGFVLVGKNDRTVEQMCSFIIDCLQKMRARANEDRPFLYAITASKEFQPLISAAPKRRRRR